MSDLCVDAVEVQTCASIELAHGAHKRVQELRTLTPSKQGDMQAKTATHECGAFYRGAPRQGETYRKPTSRPSNVPP